MRALKIAGWVVAGLLGVSVAALVLAWALFDPNAHKAQLQSAFRDATGRELRLEGPLSLSIFPWLAVEAGQASVSNRAGFGNEPFAALAHARLGVRLWPLLTSRRVEFGQVRVAGLQLHLAVARDGSNNWSDLLDRLARDDRTPAPQTGKQPVELTIAGLELEDAGLVFEDSQAGSSYAVRDWDLRTGALRRGASVNVETSFDAVRNSQPLGRVELHSAVELAEADRLLLRAPEGRFSLSRPGRDPLVVELRAPSIAMANATRDLTVERLEARLGQARLVTSLAVSQGPRGPGAQGNFELTETNARELLAAMGISPPATSDGKALQKLRVAGKLTYASTSGLQFDALEATLDDTQLRGRVGIDDLDRMAVRFDLAGTDLNLDRYLPPPSKTGAPSPSPSPSSSPSPSPAAPPDSGAGTDPLEIAGTLRFDRLTVAAIPLANVKGKLRVAQGKLAFAPLEAGAFGGRTTATLDYDYAATVPTLRIAQELEGVDVEAMLGTLFGVRQLQGKGNASFELTSQGEDGAALFANLAGPFDVEVANGSLVGADLWFEIQRAVTVAKLNAPSTALKNRGRTDFQRLAARGTLRNRVLRNERMEFVTDFAKVDGRGQVDYGRNQLDLALTARLLKLPTDELFGMKTGKLQGTPVPLTVGGTMQAPKVRPDVSKLVQALAKGKLQKPLEDELKKQLEKLLKF